MVYQNVAVLMLGAVAASHFAHAATVVDIATDHLTLTRRAPNVVKLTAHAGTEYAQCLAGPNNALQWVYDCNGKSVIQFQAPAKDTNTKLRTADGKLCLGIVASKEVGATPRLRLLPCSKSDADTEQQWTFKYGAKKNQLRSMTKYGQCIDPADGQGGDPIARPCKPGENPGPMCLSTDDGYAWVPPCSTFVLPVSAVPVSAGPTPAEQFNEALKGMSLFDVDGPIIGQVLNGHNDKSETYPVGTSLKDMIKKCNALCVKYTCDSFEVVLNKRLCNISLTGGKRPSELKPDPNAAVFFRFAE